MKHKIFLLATLLLSAAVFTSCNNQKDSKKAPEKIISFDLTDPATIHELLHFYITNDIIPEEAVLCDHEAQGGMHTWECISEDLEYGAPDYMQDSLHGTFFQEISYHPGSSGDNNIYICKKDEKGFHLLKSITGTTDPDLGPENEFCNGYKVLYFLKDDEAYRLYYDGKDFVEEPATAPALAHN